MKARELKISQVFRIKNQNYSIFSFYKQGYNNIIKNILKEKYELKELKALYVIADCVKEKKLEIFFDKEQEVELCAESCSGCKRDFGSYCLEANNSGQCGDCFGNEKISNQ